MMLSYRIHSNSSRNFNVTSLDAVGYPYKLPGNNIEIYAYVNLCRSLFFQRIYCRNI